MKFFIIVSLLLAAGAVRAEPAQITTGVGVLGLFDDDKTLQFSFDYRFAVDGPHFQARLLASWATDNSRFIGVGLLYNLDLTPRWRVTAGAAPGYYERNRGRDLGSTMEFLSTLEVSARVVGHERVGLSIGHVSNGGLKNTNPGSELLQVFWSVPLGH
jgi:hypothetical protein